MKIYTTVSINIIILFMIAIMSSFIPELFPDFFGDWICEGRKFIPNKETYGSYIGCDMFQEHNPTTHFGYRHYLWFLMGIVLFIIQGIRIFMVVDKHDKNE